MPPLIDAVTLIEQPEDLIADVRTYGVEIRWSGRTNQMYQVQYRNVADGTWANLPLETQLEETYYHRLNPPQGFAFQRVYTDDRSLDESMAVENHDTVMVPCGYHPCVAPHGYDLYYLNVMAGPQRHWVFKNDPVHERMLKR